jgi:hypothetical protein
VCCVCCLFSKQHLVLNIPESVSDGELCVCCVLCCVCCLFSKQHLVLNIPESISDGELCLLCVVLWGLDIPECF